MSWGIYNFKTPGPIGLGIRISMGDPYTLPTPDEDDTPMTSYRIDKQYSFFRVYFTRAKKNA